MATKTKQTQALTDADLAALTQLRQFVVKKVEEDGTDGARMFGASLLKALGTTPKTRVQDLASRVKGMPDDAIEYALAILDTARTDMHTGRPLVTKLRDAAFDGCKDYGIRRVGKIIIE